MRTAASALSSARSYSNCRDDAMAAPPSATNGTFVDAYPVAIASRCAPAIIVRETEASIAGRGDRSVGMCTSRSLNMHASRSDLDIQEQHMSPLSILTHV